MKKHNGKYFLVCEDCDCDYEREAKPDECHTLFYRCRCPECGNQCECIWAHQPNLMPSDDLDDDPRVDDGNSFEVIAGGEEGDEIQKTVDGTAQGEKVKNT